MVRESIELLSAQARGKNLSLACIIDPQTPTALRGDPGRLRQILVNLIGNAIKFTESGEVLTAVSGADGLTARVRVEVRDTGCGIPPRARETIFQAFTQADGSATRKHGGTGLGLTICRDLALRMGGEIGVESDVGKGSTFWFVLPFEKQPAHVAQLPLVEVAPRSETVALIR